MNNSFSRECLDLSLSCRHSGQWDASVETRHLKGLGADGSLVFDDDPYPRFQR
uniref:SAM-dependent methyltransferase n=1 Tax=Angiostrongylus cantonensis TaxID=6313 RepID=A0A0K0D756_ANGCA